VTLEEVAVRKLIAVLAASVAVVLSGGPARAEEPLALDAQLVDEAGVLSAAEESAVQESLDRLQAEDGTQLHVVFVDTFDGLDAGQWLSSTYDRSGLGGNDALMAVAVQDDDYRFTVPSSSEVTVSEADQLAGRAVRPEFSEGDWTTGTVAFADILRTGEVPGGADDGSGGGGALLVLGAIGLVGGGAYLVSRNRRRRREAQPPPVRRIERPDPFAGTTTDELQGRASSALLELDEAMKTSQLELDYARVQYGEEAVAGFGQALAQSRDELSRAFAIRQQLDDGIGGRETGTDEPTTRRMLGDMLRLTDAADARLEEQAEAFSRLRDLENTAPQVLDALLPRMGALRERIPQVERQLADLRGRYADSALAPVRDNATEARARLAAAEQEAEEARAAIGAGNPAEAVGGIRAAEDAVAQSGTLLDAVGRLAADLDVASGRVTAVRTETEKDLAEARALVGTGRHDGLRPQIARAEAALAAADQALAVALADPLAALRQLEEADMALEQALSVARDAQTQARRAAASTRRCSPRGPPSRRPPTSSTRAGAPSARRRAPGWPRRGGTSTTPWSRAGTTRSVPCGRPTRRRAWPSRPSTSPRTTSTTGPVGATAAGTGHRVATAGATAVGTAVGTPARASTWAASSSVASSWAVVAGVGPAAVGPAAAGSAVAGSAVAAATRAAAASAAPADDEPAAAGSDPARSASALIRRVGPVPPVRAPERSDPSGPADRSVAEAATVGDPWATPGPA
jgi:hypothetical protein